MLSTWLDWYSIDARPIETKKFSVSKFLTKFFFMHHLCLGFTCIVLFFCIYLAVLQLYLSLFSHITCINFAKLDTQLDLKIDWLIFESFVHFSICYFLCVNCCKYFSKEIWWIINVQIFSLLMQLFMGHIVSSLHLLKERIFFSYVSLT